MIFKIFLLLDSLDAAVEAAYSLSFNFFLALSTHADLAAPLFS